MASILKALKMTALLVDIAMHRAKELGYSSWAAYIKALIRHDAACRASHGITVPWSEMPLEEQDKLDEVILKRVERAQGMKSTQLKDWDWRAELPQR